METITVNDVSYTIGEQSEPLSDSVNIHNEVGDSEFDYVIVGTNPDSDDTDDVIAFGFHRYELPNMPLPEEE